MTRRLEGRVAVVTGAASGIGAATARRFSDEGARVVLGDLDEAGGSSVAGECGGAFVRTDVTQEDQLQALLSEAVERHGRLDVVCNNAGILVPGTLPDLAPEDWRRVIDVDLNSVYYGCRAAIPHLRASGGGAIVNLASVSGLAGDYAMPAYNAAKAGVLNFTRAIAMEHAREGIRVNAVCPGVIDTPMSAAVQAFPKLVDAYHQNIPMGRFGRAEEIAATIAFLASDDASYVTGAALVADGGLTAGTGQPHPAQVLDLP
ncbi:MAG: SDR family NAD(P)-dependent oxidoreductase [Myxococcota bacterium]|nr:SDR family NAD(P)-dependent oxidoreductase [Myxococcota bacterium]